MSTSLTLEKTPPSQQCTKKPPLTGIFRFASRSDIPLLCVGTILIILSAISSPMQTLIYGKIFDKLARFLSGNYTSLGGFLHDLRVLLGAMLAVAGGRLLFAWSGITMWLIVGENTQRLARKSLFDSLLSKEIEWLGTKENLIGSLTLMFRCIEEIRSGISENLGLFVQTVASVCCLFIIAMISSWSLTLIICCSIPLSAVSSCIFGSLTSRFATRENFLNARASKILDWCFVSGAMVRVLNGKISDLVHFSRVVDASAIAYTKMAAAISANTAVLKLLSNFVVVGGLAFGQHLVHTGQLGLGNVITAFSACVLFGAEISAVGDIVALLNKAQASSNTIDTLDFGDSSSEFEKPLSSPTSDLSSLGMKTPCSSMTLHNLSFRYFKTDTDVVDNVTMSFVSTHLNFIVGESGSGKSTVASILAGFLKKTKGDAFVDTLSFEDLSSDWFTDHVCFVESRPLVFERSLAENLLLGTHYDPYSQRTKVLLEEACEFADLSVFVSSLPSNLDTVLVSSKLSGGQIQKIGLARAYIANRPILILDEALGSINQKSKSIIMERLRVWRNGMLTVVITHDLADVRGQDSVSVMARGKVKSTGSAADLRDILPSLDIGPRVKMVYDEEELDFIEGSERETKTKTETSPYDYLTNPVILRDLENTQGAGEIEHTQTMGLFAIVGFCMRTTENKFLIIIGLICALLGGVATPGLSYCFAEVLSVIVRNAVMPDSTGKHMVLTWCMIIVAVAIGESAVTFGSRMALQYASEQWILKLRKMCVAKINDQDMSFFATATPTYLNTLLMNDTRDLRNLVSEFLSGLLLLISLTMLGLVWAIVIGWKLALVGMAFVPVVFLVTMAYSVLLQKYETAYKDHVASAEKFAQETVTAIRTVRSFGLAPQLSREFSAKLSNLYHAGCLRAVSAGFGIALSEFCGTAATATVLYYGMTLVVHDQYTQKQMIQVLTMLTFTVASASHLMKSLPEITRGQRAGTLIVRLINLAESEVECGGLAKSAKPQSSSSVSVLRFENVSFSYADSQSCSYKPVLKNTSFEMYQGEAVVIAGECGSGKSTIALLASRLYGPDRGHIFYGEKKIQDYDPEWYRNNVVLVSQEPAFFEGSILENLFYGMSATARATTETFLVECLAAANALEFVEALPQKLHTILDQECSLSSGQLQRLSIARVLLRKPKLLIFDEPTSRLDSENTARISELIFDNLRKLDPFLTIVVISHDPRVMARGSRILMVQKGKIVEEGEFETLLNKNGPFAAFMM